MDDDRGPAPAPTIRTQADLGRTWRFVLEPLGPRRAGTWMMLLGPEGHPHPSVTEVEDDGGPPGPDDLERLVRVAALLLGELAPGGRWAFLRMRPGDAGVTDADRSWGRTLLAACRAAGVPTEVVHLATDAGVVALADDDLAGAA